jgi:hypothetical protein
MLSARTFFHPRRRAWLPIAIAAGIALLPDGGRRFTTVFSTAELAA